MLLPSSTEKGACIMSNEKADQTDNFILLPTASGGGALVRHC